MLEVYNLSFLKSSPVSFEKFAEHLLSGSHVHGCRSHLQKTPPSMKEINPFHTTGHFIYLLKTSENQTLSDVLQGV